MKKVRRDQETEDSPGCLGPAARPGVAWRGLAWVAGQGEQDVPHLGAVPLPALSAFTWWSAFKIFFF